MSNHGVSIHYQEKILSIQHEQGRVTHLITGRGEELTADAVILCNGVMAGRMLGSLRRYLPLQPMQGYSLSLPFNALPFKELPHALTDSRWKMVYSPLGHVLRIAGMGTVGAWGREAPIERIQLMRQAAAEWLGPALLTAEATAWSGLRPATPNGLPFIGPVPGFQNLYGNFGHGTLGWTLAPGSAALLRDLLLGHTPELPTEAFALSS